MLTTAGAPHYRRYIGAARLLVYRAEARRCASWRNPSVQTEKLPQRLCAQVAADGHAVQAGHQFVAVEGRVPAYDK